MKFSFKKTFSRLIVLFSISALIALSFGAYTSVKDKEKTAIEQGKRAVINVASGEITSKKAIEVKPQEEVKKEPTPEEKPPEEKPVEVKPDAVGGSGGEGGVEQPQQKLEEQKAVVQPTAAAPTEPEKKAEAPPKTAEVVPEAKVAEVAPQAKQDIAPPVEQKPIPAESVSAVDPNSKGAIAEKQKAKIAIIVTGMGLSRSSTTDAINMPGKFSFSFSPYSSNLKDFFATAKQKGHEVFVDLPLEPADYPISDPGPYALISSLGKEENLSRLKKIIAISEGASGFVTSREEKYQPPKEEVIPLMNELKNQNLKIVFASANDKSTIPPAISEAGLASVKADFFLDSKLNKEEILNNLAQLEKIAKEKGSAIAVVRPFPINIKIISAWLKEAKARDIELANVSEVVEARK